MVFVFGPKLTSTDATAAAVSAARFAAGGEERGERRGHCPRVEAELHRPEIPVARLGGVASQLGHLEVGLRSIRE